MGSDRGRLLVAVLALPAAGVCAALAGGSARLWTGAALLFFVALAAVWPLARTRPAAVRLPEEPRAADVQRLALLQALFEHLPVAAWSWNSEQRLQPLSSRARRLA